MKKHFLLLSLISILSTQIFLAGDGANWGIGFRLGEPSGITLKKYMGSKALEFSLGRAYIGRNDGWYNDGFHKYYKNKNYNYTYYYFTNYEHSVPLSLQIHYLFQNPLATKGDDKSGSLQWYYGGGLQMRWTTMTYYYNYYSPGDPILHSQKDRYTNLDLGLDGVLGIEYTFSNAPISIFLDATLFMEVYDTPFAFWGMGGIGARYNF